MKILILFVGWCILFMLFWPVAVVALILFPVVWLVSFPRKTEEAREQVLNI